MDYLRPAFREHSGLDLLVHSAGSGRALQLLENGEADLVISHAPLMEERLLSQHPDWSYRKFAYNRFVVVGPVEIRRGLPPPAMSLTRSNGSWTLVRGSYRGAISRGRTSPKRRSGPSRGGGQLVTGSSSADAEWRKHYVMPTRLQVTH